MQSRYSRTCFAAAAVVLLLRLLLLLLLPPLQLLLPVDLIPVQPLPLQQKGPFKGTSPCGEMMKMEARSVPENAAILNGRAEN